MAIDANRCRGEITRQSQTHGCLRCDTPTINLKYCSRSCAATVNNTVFPKRRQEDYGQCNFCAKSLNRNRSNFCSKRCYDDAWVVKWIEGTLDAEFIPSNAVAERVLRHFHGNMCQQCGWRVINVWNRRVTLTLEHRDGNPSNNLFNNLELLCYNCHTLTENFCGRNTTASRAKRGLEPVPIASRKSRRRYRAAHADVV